MSEQHWARRDIRRLRHRIQHLALNGSATEGQVAYLRTFALAVFARPGHRPAVGVPVRSAAAAEGP